jgi:sugar phosphate permease
MLAFTLFPPHPPHPPHLRTLPILPPILYPLFMRLDRLPRHVWILSIASLLADISAEMVHAVLPIFVLSDLKGGAITIGAIEGIAAATLAISRVFSGGLSDYLGMQKGLAIVGYGISTLMRPLLAISFDPFFAVFSQFADGFGQGISVAPRKALMADVSSEEMLSSVYRLRRSMLIAGACIGSTLAGSILLFSGNNFRLVFSGAVIPSCMALSLMIVAIEPVRKPRKLLMIPTEMTGLLGGREDSYVRTPERFSVSQAVRTAREYNPIDRDDLEWLGKKYWVLLVVAIIFNLGNSSDAFLLLRLVEVGVSPALIPLGLIIMSLVFALTSYPIASIVDCTIKVRMLLGGFLLHAIIYFGMAVASTDVQMWCLFGLYGLHLAMTRGLIVSLIDRSIPAKTRGTAFSIFNIAIGITLLFANLLAGLCWQGVGSGFTFAIGAFFACIATLVLLIGTDEE